MPTREPKFWAITIITSLVSASGGTAGLNYFWLNPPSPPSVDLVTQYRIDQIEGRDKELAEEIGKLKARVDKLPPPDWRERIRRIEKDVREIRSAIIHLRSRQDGEGNP